MCLSIAIVAESRNCNRFAELGILNTNKQQIYTNITNNPNNFLMQKTNHIVRIHKNDTGYVEYGVERLHV